MNSTFHTSNERPTTGLQSFSFPWIDLKRGDNEDEKDVVATSSLLVMLILEHERRETRSTSGTLQSLLPTTKKATQLTLSRPSLFSDFNEDVDVIVGESVVAALRFNHVLRMIFLCSKLYREERIPITTSTRRPSR